MALPTPADVRKVLEGYCSEALISDGFIQDSLDEEVVPFAESYTRSSFSGIRTSDEELYSGTGKDQLILNRRNIVEVKSIRLVSGNDIDTTINIASLKLMKAEGILKVRSGLSEYYNYRIFPKGNNNIQVVYTYGGDCPPDVSRALCKLTAILVLDNVEGRTGGGQLSGQSYNRQYGNMGKYSNIRKRFNQQAMAVLRKYATVVVGN